MSYRTVVASVIVRPFTCLAILLFSSLMCLSLGSPALAQTQVTLATTAAPALGQAGISVESVTGSGFPSGTIPPANVTITLTPSGGGGATTTTATIVTVIAGQTERVYFLIPSSISVSSSTAYKVSLKGTTSTGTAFVSSNSSALTINPSAAVTLSPASAQAGQSVTVSITGKYTTFVNGLTQANFGPGISVGGAAAGSYGNLTVTSATAATASLVISSSASAGARTITVATGSQQASAQFSVTSSTKTLTSIAVTPANPAVTAGGTQQFTATGTYSDSSTQNLTSSVTWASSNTVTATINPAGLASALIAGTTTISATSGSVSGSTVLTVNPVPVLYSLTVTDIGTGNGTVTDNRAKISCVTTAGVQSGTCSASYTSGTVVTLTAAPSGSSTFAAWGIACSGNAGCSVTMSAAEAVTASFTPPPQLVTLNFNPGTIVTGMATYDCPSNPAPSPTNPCLDANAHALALSIPQVLQPISLTVQATEVPPSGADGDCQNGLTVLQDFDCRFTAYFTYQTLQNGDRIVPLCYPYANGNCVHYQVYSGTPGVEPNPNNYVGPIDWNISWNNDQYTPPAPYTGSTPHLYDDPDYAVNLTSPYGTDCTKVMQVGNPPVNTNPPISCQFEFDVTTSYNPTKKVDAAITGRTKQFNDVVVAFPPNTVGNLIVTDAPLATPVAAGSAIGYTITVSDSAGGAVGGATLTDTLPSGTNVNWSISPAYSGPGTCAIAGAIGSQVLSCSFGTISASQSFTISLLSASSSAGTYVNTTIVQAGTQQFLSVATLAVTPASLTSITVTPVNPTVTAGGTQQFTATGIFSDGTTSNLTSSAVWASSSTTTATINAAGLATAVKAGSTTISATVGSVTGSTTLTVTAATLVSIAVTPVNPSVAAGGTQQFTATGTYSDSSTQNLTASATWASSSTATATINTAGLATAVKVGTTTISAKSGTVTGSTTLTVTPTPLQITTTSLPNGQLGVAYASAIAVTGGTPPYTWAVTGGAFPTPVTINPTTGAISGTPSQSGPFTVTIGVSDSGTPQQTQSSSYTFTITGVATITSASPSSGHQADTSDNIVLTGQFTHFAQGTTGVSFGSTDIAVNLITVNSPTQVTANISIATTALIGARTVTVTTGSEVAVGTSVFTVLAGVPTVTLTPNSGVEGTNPTISITGTFTNFTQGQTTASFSGDSDIIAGPVTVNSPTQATVQVQISVTAALGTRTITINTGTQSAPGSFTVTAGAPVIVTVSPNVGGQGVTSLPVTVNANFTSWVNGTTVASFGSGIAVGGGTAGGFGPVVVNNSGQLTATLNIAAGATLGPRDITVKTGTEQEIAGGAFTVENCTTTAAALLYNSPVYGASGVPLNTQVQFEFNAPLNRSTISASNVYLVDGTTGLKIPSTVTVDATGRIVTLTPGQLLGVGRNFTAYLGYATTATDACGNALSAYTYFTTTFTPETSGPSVTQTSPENNDTNVPLNTQVVLQFSVPVDPISLQSGFTVSTGGTAIPGTFTTMFTNDYTRIVFKPGSTLTASTVYTVDYTTQLTDLVGNPLVNPNSFSFTTGTATDTVTGTVTSTDPPIYGQTGIGTNVTPMFNLSKIIDPISVSSVNAYITDNTTGRLVPSTVSVSTNRQQVTITPVTPLQPGTAYVAYLGYNAGYFDLAGNNVSATYLYFFTAGSAITSGPVVTQISPTSGATGTPVNTQVVAVMSGVLNPDTVGNGAITVTPQGSSTPVTGTVTLASDQVTLTWVPSASLAISTTYNVTVSGFADTQGNTAATFTSGFSTGSNGTPVGAGLLKALSVSPANNATGVSDTAQVVITFSEVVDPATVNNIILRDESDGYYLISGTWAVNPLNGAQVTFTPAQPYPANAIIQVWTQELVRDLAGNTDIASVVTTFTVGSTVDTTAPTVTSVTPVNNATGIGRNTTVVLTFSKSINPATVSDTTIQLFVGESVVNPSLTVSANNRTVMLSSTLPPASIITVVATPNVQDLSGNKLTAFQSQFTTAADLSPTAPTVISQRPANGATDVPANAVITLFTEGSPLNPATITANSLYVSHNGVLINGTINVTGNGQAIEFVPSQNFNDGDIVQVFLTSAIQDVNGTPLTAYQGQFTITGNPGTVAPAVISTNPTTEYDATNVATNIVPQVAFDQALLASTINSTNVYLLNSSNSTHVAGTVSLVGSNNNVVQFQPSSALTSNTLYLLYLNNVANAQGTPLASSYYSYFTTGTASNPTAPTIISIAPANGSTNIGVNAQVLLRFSNAIDPISVTGSTVQISGGGQTVTPVSIAFNPPYYDTATITPQAPLPASTLMTIAINGVTDGEGNAVTHQPTTFTTGPGADFTPATVILSPVYGSTTVPTNTTIFAQYSKPMNTGTIYDNPVTTGTYLYDTVTGLHVPGTLSFSTDLTTATFVPSAPLLVGRTYTFYAYNALDLDGNLQTANYTQFTTSFAPSSTVPQVVDTNPENGLTGVPTNVIPQVLFNEAIKPEEILAQAALLQGGTGGTPVPVTPTLTQGGLLASLTPNALLLPNTTYTISVTGVQDLAGHTQSGTYTSSFTTGPTIDLVTGSVTAIDPPYNQTGVGTNTLIRVHFSTRINPISLQFDPFSLTANNTGRYLPISLTAISADRLSATFTPGAPLLPNSPYYFTLSTLYDVTGNAIYGTSTYFITGSGAVTSGPTVSAISPVNGTTGTPVNTQVMAVMSAPIDVNTVGNTAITVTPNGSTTAVAGTVTLAADQVTLTWVPSTNLTTSTLYNVSVGGFADLVGNPAVTFTSSFTTGTNATPVGAGSLTASVVTPGNNATGVSDTAQVVITFSEVVDPATVNNIVLRDESDGYYLISGTWAVNPLNGAQVTFTPAQPYPANAIIQVWTQDLVRDLAGNTDIAGVVTTFTVGSTVDTTAPTVTSVTPLNNTTNVGPYPTVVLTFSKSINPATVTTTSIQILAGDTPIGSSYAISANNRTVMISPSLSPSTIYTVVATTQVTDISGNALQYFQSQFTTAPPVSATAPTVVTQRPAYGATDVPANTVITLFISGSPLNPATVTNSSVYVTQNGVIVPGTLAVTGNNQAIEFTPTANYTPGVVVQILLESTITDVNSVPLTAYSGQFTVAGNPATVGPAVVATNPNPEYDATNVPSNIVPQVAFDQSLLASTINSTNVYLLNSSNSTHVAGTVSLVGPNNNVVQFQPSSALTSNTEYLLYLDNVTNAQGTPLASSYYSYFTTGTTSNSTAPTVLAVGPPNGATGVGVNASIVVTFSGPIDPISVTGSTIQITGGGQTVVPSTISFNTTFTMATITPEAPLPPSTVMTIAISGVTDAEGNAVASQSTTFTTAVGPDLVTPTVVLSSYQSGDTIATNTVFSYEFSEPMDPGTVNNQTFYLYDSSVGYEPGVGTVTLSGDLKTETLTLPVGTLVAGHSVFAYSTGAQDLAGNVQTAYLAGYATVGSVADTTPPVVLETNPPAGLTGVPLNVPIQIEFSKEIAQDSIAGIQLLQSGSTVVPVTVTFSRLSTVVTLTPAAPLLPSTPYTISITGVTDNVGNVFSGTHTQTFTTGTAVKLTAPVNLSVTPCCSQTGISDSTTIQIVFDSPMDPLTFDTSFGAAKLILTSTSAVVSTTVSFSVDYKTVILTPSVPLTSGTSYTVYVYYGTGGWVTDMAGNQYTSQIDTSFTAQ